jgi:hypothetical protein
VGEVSNSVAAGGGIEPSSVPICDDDVLLRH